MKLSRFVVISFLMTAPNLYAAQSWSCSNTLTEISCTEHQCDIKTESFTPFQINIAQDNKISICAYSGCWSGQTNSTKHLHFTSYSTQTLTWNEHTSKAEAFLLGIDTRNHTGFLLGEGFSLPLNCTPE
ncbi:MULTISPECIES: hypothetical protein [Acinetobacter]|jgi:hypothetical protein|uniref:hypothetical protein n=1 Tax=Acinetobacter TaxID=469 RepID=UPI0014492F96|nr:MULTISPECIES: hypothetical protein [Acinetobacter]MCO8081137.1 hypothetical protein [Acinetobacter lwoffii]QJB49126.1 hypothetical protein HGD77_10655 [Acinetobacter sp. NEB149]